MPKFILFVTLAAAISPSRAVLYVPPASSFITSPSGSEAIVTVDDSSGSIATAQSALNAARTANASAVLVLRLNAASYSVSSAGLLLGSNECLIIGSGTTISAASGSATAAYLVGVSTGSINVSISGGTLNGTGANLNCIQVNASSRVNISSLTAKNAALNVIQVYGSGQTSFDSELTVAGCTISQSTGTDSGISLHNATQAVIISNTISACGGSGIYAKDCADCTIADNTCTGNATGIYVLGNGNSVTDNTCSSNATGISLAGNGTATSANLCTSNTVGSNTTVGIAVAGIGDTVFDNNLSGNAVTTTLAGSANNLIARKAAFTAGQNYFYPPLTDDLQTGAIMNGLGRTDLTLSASTYPNLSQVQTQYNTAYAAAQAATPKEVLVLHLNGTFTGNASLTLAAETCVILSGTINLNSGITGITASNASYISVSGGTIDGGGSTSAVALSFPTGCSMIQVDGMTIQHFGPTTPRSGTAAVHFAGDGTPCMVTRCTLNQGSARGLWMENAGYTLIASRNTITNFNMDAIDCDAHTAGALVKYNTCTGNVRCGVFVEQGDTYVQLIGNTLNTNGRSGFSVWNNGVSANISPTEYNTAVSNVCDSSTISGGTTGYGFETGSQAGSAYQEYTAHNFCFNNEAESNAGTGQQDADIGQGLNGSTGSVQNYYSQNLVMGNATDFALSSNGGDLFFNSAPYFFDPVDMSPVGSGAPVGVTADTHTPFGEMEYLNATGTGQTMTLTTPPTIAGSYSIQLGYKAYTARGKCTVTVDGMAVGGTIDEYSATTQYLTGTLGTLTLAAGQHTIVMTVTGKDSASTAYTIDADSVRLSGQ